jgi:hypothetical protein
MAYEAKDLAEVADYFAVLASDQRACIGRFTRTAKAKAQCETEARIWDEAANILRQTTLTGTKP